MVTFCCTCRNKWKAFNSNSSFSLHFSSKKSNRYTYNQGEDGQSAYVEKQSQPVEKQGRPVDNLCAFPRGFALVLQRIRVFVTTGPQVLAALPGYLLRKAIARPPLFRVSPDLTRRFPWVGQGEARRSSRAPVNRSEGCGEPRPGSAGGQRRRARRALAGRSAVRQGVGGLRAGRPAMGRQFRGGIQGRRRGARAGTVRACPAAPAAGARRPRGCAPCPC